MVDTMINGKTADRGNDYEQSGPASNRQMAEDGIHASDINFTQGKTTVQTVKLIYPQIYAYTTPTVTDKQGWVKIGYTTRKDVEKRIGEQLKTADIDFNKLWNAPAKFHDQDKWFIDKDFHRYLRLHKHIEQKKGREWFNYNDKPEKSWLDFNEFINFNPTQAAEIQSDYILRAEQEEAVSLTVDYAKSHPNGEFLWNAKPRFGKTLSTYDFVKRMHANNVLIVTNRPAIANSWFDDFEKFIAGDEDYNYRFVSTTDSLKERPVLTREEFQDIMFKDETVQQIAFISLQDLKGSIYFGGEHNKLGWVADLHWDILVIDEAHEGVDTFKTEKAFEQLKRDFTLHLSGTPFKALATQKFSADQIYNWTYADEQRTKRAWDDEVHEEYTENPYESLPELRLFSYQMSPMIQDEVKKGANIEGEELDFAFNLQEFFETDDNGKFIHETHVKKWLDTLTRNEKYPFSTSALRKELSHTFWYLNRVASAKALAKLLKEHPTFEHYGIVLAAGDGITDDEGDNNQKALDRVREAIKQHDRTITLSVGQLTTGVTIPEWTGVLMLCNLESPAQYMQAAFRAQNPWKYKKGDAWFAKENAYVFDFAPERTLIIYDEFANNLSPRTAGGHGTSSDREENIKELLNFFPVIGEDSAGQMKELNVTEVLTMPKVFKAREVVSRGFMCNLLFQNVSGIFQSERSKEILEKLATAEQGKLKEQTRNTKIDTKDVEVNEAGNVEVSTINVTANTETHFGQPVYTEVVNRVADILPTFPVEPAEIVEPTAETEAEEQGEETPVPTPPVDIMTHREQVKIRNEVKNVAKDVMGAAVANLAAQHGLSNSTAKSLTNRGTEELVLAVQHVQVNHEIEKKKADVTYKAEVAEAKKNNDVQALEELHKAHEEAKRARQAACAEAIKQTVAEKVQEVSEQIVNEAMHRSEEKKKNTVEDDVRARLRGFARTIPSFLMAYGTTDTTLENFDECLEDAVFEEVTGITIKDFQYLRDEGHFFEPITFNESVQEFLRKREALANYFDESQEEDIFDYIPPQKTNQIFTPKDVVKMMIDKMEAEDPNLFKDKTKTFADLYMKSGLYIAEVVKRLYKGLAEEMPNEEERLAHIFAHQVYGFAPTTIIHRIATRFIFGFDEGKGDNPSRLAVERGHIVHLDTVPYAKGEEGYDFEVKCEELFGSTR